MVNGEHRGVSNWAVTLAGSGNVGFVAHAENGRGNAAAYGDRHAVRTVLNEAVKRKYPSIQSQCTCGICRFEKSPTVRSAPTTTVQLGSHEWQMKLSRSFSVSELEQNRRARVMYGQRGLVTFGQSGLVKYGQFGLVIMGGPRGVSVRI